MKFFSRKAELKLLNEAYERVDQAGQMVVITGKRRIGKTYLSLHFASEKPHLYLFVSKKSEHLLCQEFVKQIQQNFDLPIFGEITQFKEIFALLLDIGKKRPYVLIIDEFQEFFQINPSIYSEIQQLWDLHKFESKVEVLFLGSVYSLMNKIFEDSKEPLFGRADRIIHLRPFPIKDIHAILTKEGDAALDTLFNYYLFTGGTPKYIDWLLSQKAFSYRDIVDFLLSEHSPFLDEGRNVLIEEFGKEYGNYFSILELIASGKTSRSEIESILEKEIGGFLEKLENDYGIIRKYRSIDAKPQSRNVRYKIKDHFLRFWFRFIHRNRSAIETGNFGYVQRDLEANFSMFSGPTLEQFFIDLFASSHQYNKIGSYFESDHTNEIDLVAINELDKKMVIAEVKKNKHKGSVKGLRYKSEKLLSSYKDYSVEYEVLSLEDASRFLV